MFELRTMLEYLDSIFNEFDKEKIIKYEKEFNKILLNNKKYLEIEAKINGESFEEVKKSYKETHDYKDDYSLSINIYTVKGNQFAGFDIEVNGFRNIYYYVDEKGKPYKTAGKIARTTMLLYATPIFSAIRNGI